MNKGMLMMLVVIALLSGLGWAVISGQSAVVMLGVVVLSLCLGGLSWRVGE